MSRSFCKMESLAEPSKDGDGEAVTSEAEPRATVEVKEMSRDEHHLAVLGYRQVFTRTLGLFENWAATFVRLCTSRVLLLWLKVADDDELC